MLVITRAEAVMEQPCGVVAPSLRISLAGHKGSTQEARREHGRPRSCIMSRSLAVHIGPTVDAMGNHDDPEERSLATLCASRAVLPLSIQRSERCVSRTRLGKARDASS